MKRIHLLLPLLLLLTFSSQSYAQANYQEAIKSAFQKDLRTNTRAKTLKGIQSELASQIKNNPHNTQLIYWLAYNEYWQASYFEKMRDEDTAEELLEKGIQQLEDLDHKSSEEYALLSLLQCSYMKYTSFGRIKLAKKMGRNSRKAISLDKKNPRAYVVAGIIDLARPKMFGGGKVIEQHLLKVINELSSAKDNSSQIPSWGREEAYEYLVRYYIEEERKDKARNYLSLWEKEFPQSPNIKSVQKLL